MTKQRSCVHMPPDNELEPNKGVDSGQGLIACVHLRGSIDFNNFFNNNLCLLREG